MHISNQFLVFCDDLLAAWDGISCHKIALLLGVGPRQRMRAKCRRCLLSPLYLQRTSQTPRCSIFALEDKRWASCNCFSACRVRCAVVVRQLPRFVLELTCPTGSPRKRRADCCHLWIMFFVNLNIPGFLREFSHLTPSLPRYHLKTANKKAGNPKPLRICVFFFSLACERIFIKTHSIECELL